MIKFVREKKTLIKFSQKILRFLGWLRIVLSPLVAGVAIGIAIWIYYPTISGMIIGGLVAAAGLLIGILWANRVSRSEDPNDALSRIYETPDLNELMEKNSSKDEKQ